MPIIFQLFQFIFLTSEQAFNFPGQRGDRIHISMVLIVPKHQFKR